KAAVALNPATSVEAVREIAPYIDMVNVMTVEPGFGGQSFIPSSPAKIRRLREVAPDVEIEVDGGIDPETVPLVVAAGATVLVAGLAHLDRRRDVHEHEAPARLDQAPHIAPRGVVRRDRRAHRDPPVLGDLRGHEADAPDVQVAVLFREPQLG